MLFENALQCIVLTRHLKGRLTIDISLTNKLNFVVLKKRSEIRAHWGTWQLNGDICARTYYCHTISKYAILYVNVNMVTSFKVQTKFFML